MPTYDYQCTTCGNRFDVSQSIKADTLKHCPESLCEQEEKGKGLVVRVISGGSGVIYTGDGFYLTDYVKKTGAPSKDERSGSTADASGKESSGKESSGKERSGSTADASGKESSGKESSGKERSGSPADAGTGESSSSSSPSSPSTRSASSPSTPSPSSPSSDKK